MRSSNGTSNSASVVAAARIVARSEVDPMMIPTTGVSIAQPFGSPEVAPSIPNGARR
jgi:hypothetical protein